METLERLNGEFKKFEKLQIEHESLLQERVEYTNSVIIQLIIQNDLTRVFEIAKEIEKNWIAIKELQSFSQSLNQRQKLFGHPVSTNRYIYIYICLWYKILFIIIYI